MLLGLTRLEEQMAVERYFDGFSWDPPPAIDPEMPAGDFLDSL